MCSLTYSLFLFNEPRQNSAARCPATISTSVRYSVTNLGITGEGGLDPSFCLPLFVVSSPYYSRVYGPNPFYNRKWIELSSCIYINNFISIHKSQQSSLIHLNMPLASLMCAACRHPPEISSGSYKHLVKKIKNKLTKSKNKLIQFMMFVSKNVKHWCSLIAKQKYRCRGTHWPLIETIQTTRKNTKTWDVAGDRQIKKSQEME